MADMGENGPGESVAVLCRANVCRSPMAAALLARRLAALGLAVPVWSAGMLRDGDPVLPGVAAAMSAYGLPAGAHRSRVAAPADLAQAALVLCMARENLRHAVVIAPEVWPRAFTLRELVRRGGQIGPRPAGEPLQQWLWRAHEGRDRASLLGDAPGDDVADPAGGLPQAYADAAAELDRLTAQLVALCWAAAAGHG
jgi:protein-tyrosine phosphatase